MCNVNTFLLLLMFCVSRGAKKIQGKGKRSKEGVFPCYPFPALHPKENTSHRDYGGYYTPR
jgi:hypothetical protein